jgi:hypothetical protein
MSILQLLWISQVKWGCPVGRTRVLDGPTTSPPNPTVDCLSPKHFEQVPVSWSGIGCV